MHVDIFLRTYHKDLRWLDHALASIHKHVTGFRRIIITIPMGQGYLLDHLTAETVIEVPDLTNGYIGQQLTKMEAWRYTDADCVLFWDSDVVAIEPINIMKEYFHDGKPILYKTRYSSIDSPWQDVTARAVGFTPEWEYMRRMPLIYYLSDVSSACGHVISTHNLSLEYYLSRQPTFSEFNVIGALIDRYAAEKYHIVDTESIDMPPNKVKQFWSWGGITDEVHRLIKEALG